MARPRKTCLIRGEPMSNVFKPKGIPACDLKEVILSVEGLEAIRLNDLEKMDQETAAGQMNVSRQTFGRLLSEARGQIANALVNGKLIKIHGGSYILHNTNRRCLKKRGIFQGKDKI